jgi:hypothetical protein
MTKLHKNLLIPIKKDEPALGANVIIKGFSMVSRAPSPISLILKK